MAAASLTTRVRNRARSCDARRTSATSSSRAGVFSAWLLLALFVLAPLAQAAPRVGVATMQPGDIFFERFGHNAIVVDDPAFAEPVSYNFGFFDMTEPDFMSRFVLGDMRYRLVALPLSQDLAYYAEVGRGVSIQWLDLDPTEAEQLALALAINARPENAVYSYDYFIDNCSTRVRDALDAATGGLLQRRLAVRSRGNTFRGDAVRLASPAPWMWLGFDLGLGPAADRPNALWNDAFVPMRLADALDGLRRDDGRPLVAATETLLPHRLASEPAEAPRPWWPWLLAGLVLAVAIRALGARRPRMLAAIALPLWTLCGVLGLVMVFLWGFTAHHFAWANQNLLLFTPLCLLLLHGGWKISRGHTAGAAFRVLAWLVAAGAVLALFLHWLPVLPQRNVHWIALMLPIHVALAWALATRPRD
ncbi:DUF4105 domain-containing protein [Luteimonas kalidii]|uniref:DUF4105 domain-containing protein n=1 Tax=Luteimonas kalidii TaxID=3042025 RepID=A0ABT6JYE3_9GAMM|nr:DUF4105 domain-containing protein [Luteimonas kalidii]MDH5835500.1 DUF4105 domain-containing protein [Luteimonas kalidii]